MIFCNVVIFSTPQLKKLIHTAIKYYVYHNNYKIMILFELYNIFQIIN